MSFAEKFRDRNELASGDMRRPVLLFLSHLPCMPCHVAYKVSSSVLFEPICNIIRLISSTCFLSDALLYSPLSMSFGVSFVMMTSSPLRLMSTQSSSPTSFLGFHLFQPTIHTPASGTPVTAMSYLARATSLDVHIAARLLPFMKDYSAFGHCHLALSLLVATFILSLLCKALPL